MTVVWLCLAYAAVALVAYTAMVYLDRRYAAQPGRDLGMYALVALFWPALVPLLVLIKTAFWLSRRAVALGDARRER